MSQSVTNKKLGQRQQHRPYKNFRFLIAITIVCFFALKVNHFADICRVDFHKPFSFHVIYSRIF